MEPHCKATRDAFTDYLERSLSARERESVRSHLNACADCADALDMTRALVGTLESLEETALPDGFNQRLSARLNQAAAHLPARSPVPQRKRWADFFRPLAPQVRVLAGVAVAVLVTVAVVLTGQSPIGQSPAGQPVQTAGVVPAAHAERVSLGGDATVRIRFDASRAVEQVRFTIELPPGLRMVSGGQVVENARITWQGALAEGVNIIPLKVRGVARGAWQVTAAVEKGAARKERSIELLVNGV